MDDCVIVTDGEVAIVNAIMRNIPQCNCKLVSCRNHILMDVQYWLRKRSASSSEIAVYKSQITEIMMCDTPDAFSLKLASFRPTWSEAFVTYYNDHLSNRIEMASSSYLIASGLDGTGMTTKFI